jgi:hypothetical protein
MQPKLLEVEPQRKTSQAVRSEWIEAFTHNNEDRIDFLSAVDKRTQK